jgi:tetratricopeptide (TPR) repeat protein
VQRDSASATAQKALGHALAVANDPRGALAAFQLALKLEPTDDDAALRVARTWAKLEQPEQERDAYLATIAARPHCWAPRWWLATWYTRHGQVDASVAAYREMIRCDPDRVTGFSSLGGQLVQRGEYGAAIDTLQRAVAIRPDDVAYQNLGIAYFNLGRLQESVDAFNQSFQFGNATYVSWMNIGDAYYFLRGRRDQAAEAYGQALELGRRAVLDRLQHHSAFNAQIPADLSTVFARLGRPDSARVYLRAALSADSTNSMVQYGAALTCWELRERESALAWLAKAVGGGYPVAWLRDSPVFREWRSLEGFRSLVAGTGPSPPVAPSPGKGGRT